jgi:hypothetical protein
MNFEDVSAPVSPPAYGPPAKPRIRRPLPVLVAAIGIVVAYVALALLPSLAASLYSWASGRFSDSVFQAGSIAGLSLSQDVPQFVVIVIIAFLFFWGATPIHGAMGLAQVIGRSIGTAIVAGLACGLVVAVRYVGTVDRLAGVQAGSARPTDVLRAVAEAAVQGVGFFAQVAPLVVLGGVILWNWTRAHPLARSVVTGDPGAPVRV